VASIPASANKKRRIHTPFIPAKAGIQEKLGPRFRGDERAMMSAM
jgi:hypothetical protein